MRTEKAVLILFLVCSFSTLNGQDATSRDAELTRLMEVLEKEKIDYYRDETRIVIVERLSQLKEKEKLIEFVGRSPKESRYTIAWLRENLILIDFLLRENTQETKDQAEVILEALLKLDEAKFLKGEISGDRLKALQSPGGREMHYPPPKEVLDQQAKERVARAETLVKKSLSEQRNALANRLALLALQAGGIDKLTEIMKDLPAEDIQGAFKAQMSRAIMSDK